MKTTLVLIAIFLFSTLFAFVLWRFISGTLDPAGSYYHESNMPITNPPDLKEVKK